MKDVTALNALIGAAMPMAIALINQSGWNSKLKALVAVITCLLAAVVVEAVRGDVVWRSWRETAMVIVGVAIVSYHTWWKPSTLASSIEVATTIGGPSHPRSSSD